MLDGVLLINKPLGMTSRDVVNKVCKILGTKKIGHTGTLDPNASGVLALCIGPSTKIVQFLTSESKSYVAEITLGITSDTLDLDGKITETKVCDFVSKETLIETLESFKGASKQIPPMYSALKVKGKRLHELAREGVTIEREARDIFIDQLDLVSDIECGHDVCKFKVETLVSKGTYIRSLAFDIGAKLGYPSLMSSLERTVQGEFKISDCYSLEQVENGDYKLITKDQAMKSMNNVTINDESLAKRIYNGAVIDRLTDDGKDVAIYFQDRLLAVYQVYHKDHTKIKPVRVFKDASN
jgi:tRNA pseudouridine55 synthase